MRFSPVFKADYDTSYVLLGIAAPVPFAQLTKDVKRTPQENTYRCQKHIVSNHVLQGLDIALQKTTFKSNMPNP